MSQLLLKYRLYSFIIAFLQTVAGYFDLKNVMMSAGDSFFPFSRIELV